MFSNSRANQEIAENTFILNAITGKTVGKLRKCIDKNGLALMRLSQIDNENMKLVDKMNKEVKVKVEIPKFWQLDEALLNELKSSKF